MAYIMINGNKVYWEDYLELSKTLKDIKNFQKVISGTVSFNKKGQDFDIDKKNYTKHVLIERLVIKDEYEFNFIDLETKEFYWSYYTSDRNYNVAKKAFENVFKYKGVKYYLEE